MLLGAGKKLMFAEGDMILAARVKRAGYVTMGHQQLRVLALAQRRQQAIFTGAGGAHQPNQFSPALKDPLSPAPDMVDLDMFAATVRQHQSARFPSAMTPRSSRPSACAGC